MKIDGIRWIRLFYLYPHYFTDELMDLIVKEEKICPYVDLPLQHISQSVLKRMNRRDSEADVRVLREEALQSRPHADPALDVHRRLPWRNGRRIPGTL